MAVPDDRGGTRYRPRDDRCRNACSGRIRHFPAPHIRFCGPSHISTTRVATVDLQMGWAQESLSFWLTMPGCQMLFYSPLQTNLRTFLLQSAASSRSAGPAAGGRKILFNARLECYTR